MMEIHMREKNVALLLKYVGNVLFLIYMALNVTILKKAVSIMCVLRIRRGWKRPRQDHSKDRSKNNIKKQTNYL